MSNGRHWTPEHTATLERMAPYCHDHEIAKITGHCVDTVQRRRSMLGISPYRGTPVRYGTWADLSRRQIDSIAAHVTA